MSAQSIDLTAPVAEETETRSKVRRGLTVVGLVAGVILLVDWQAQRFARSKRVTVTVADKPDEA